LERFSDCWRVESALKSVSSPDAGSEVLRRAGSSVEESGSSEYLRTGVTSKRSSEATVKETISCAPKLKNALAAPPRCAGDNNFAPPD